LPSRDTKPSEEKDRGCDDGRHEDIERTEHIGKQVGENSTKHRSSLTSQITVER
jgi:hypothetical protein